MATKRRGLGRGLDALLSTPEGADGAAPGESATTLKELAVDLLQPGKYQPRVDMQAESLEELADSIQAQGVVQPIVVRPIGSGRYEIIAGERRWRAAQIAGLHEIPAVIRDVPDSAAIAMALIENIQRENLNPLEEANALNRLIDEFDMTHAEAAQAVGRSRTAVTNLLRLLDLENPVKKLVETRALEMGHARALLGLKNGEQIDAANLVVGKGLSVRETERLVKKFAAGPVTKKTAAQPNADVRHFQDQLSEKLGAKVVIQHAKSGKGKLVISYHSLDELDGILKHIK